MPVLIPRLRTRLVWLAIAAVVPAIAVGGPTSAESRGIGDGDIITTAANTGIGGTTSVTVSGGRIAIPRSGRSPHHGARHPNPVDCSYFALVGGFAGVGWGAQVDWATASALGAYGIECVNTVTAAVVRPRTLVIAAPGGAAPVTPPGISAADLAAEATAGLEVPVPSPSANPVGGATIVHFPTWLWTGGWQMLTASASAAGITSTVTATPEEVRWDMGDGHALRCHGPGVAYDLSLPDAAQHSGCTYSYADAGRYAVDATIVWRLTWTSPGNGGGDLGTVARTGTLPLEVVQLDTVIRDR